MGFLHEIGGEVIGMKSYKKQRGEGGEGFTLQAFSSQKFPHSVKQVNVRCLVIPFAIADNPFPVIPL